MTLTHLYDALDTTGIKLGLRLVVDSPTGTATPEIRAALAEHKPSLVWRLASGGIHEHLDGVRWAVDPSLSADGYDTEERQAIQDADARPPYLPDDDPKIVVMVDRVIACAPMSPMEIQP